MNAHESFCFMPYCHLIVAYGWMVLTLALCSLSTAKYVIQLRLGLALDRPYEYLMDSCLFIEVFAGNETLYHNTHLATNICHRLCESPKFNDPQLVAKSTCGDARSVASSPASTPACAAGKCQIHILQMLHPPRAAGRRLAPPSASTRWPRILLPPAPYGSQQYLFYSNQTKTVTS